MQRFAPVVVFALTFVLGGLFEVAPVHAADEEVEAHRAKAPLQAGETKVIEVRADSPKNPVPGGPNDEGARWWEDPKVVKALSLTDEQRKKMGEHLDAYRKNVPANQKPEAFHETLVQGDWKAAHSENEKMAKNAGTAIRMRGTLKIEVLSLLSKEQREILVDRYPQLIYKPWRRAMRGASSR
jgi:Spy/CpxP family protein refolding chaperone